MVPGFLTRRILRPSVWVMPASAANISPCSLTYLRAGILSRVARVLTAGRVGPDLLLSASSANRQHKGTCATTAVFSTTSCEIFLSPQSLGVKSEKTPDQTRLHREGSRPPPYMPWHEPCRSTTGVAALLVFARRQPTSLRVRDVFQDTTKSAAKAQGTHMPPSPPGSR